MFVPSCMVPGRGCGEGYVNIGKQAETARDVTTIESEYRQFAYGERDVVDVLDGEVEIQSVKLGRLEIRPIGTAPPWGCEILLNGEPVKQVTAFTLSCGVGEVPRLTLEMIVLST